MKTKWSIVAIALSMVFSCHLFAQQKYTLTLQDQPVKKDTLPMYNLFYLSKLIANKGLDQEQKKKVYYAIDQLIPEIRYTDHSVTQSFISGIEQLHIDRLTNDFHKNIFTNVESAIIEEYDKNKGKGKTPLNDLFSEIKKLKDSYNNKLSVQNEYEGLINNSKQEFNEADKSAFKEKLDSTGIKIDFQEKEIKKDTVKTKVFIINEDSLKKEVDSKIANLKIDEAKSTLDKKIEEFLQEYVKSYLEKYKSIDTLKSLPNSVTKSGEAIQQQITINAQIQAAHAQSSSGISIPSQSQMIEAMAIFLAKRAKQEAAIWFMDQVRMKMNNPMVLDVFPETIKVLESNETYKVPTFNTTWKYALAKDFVEMPKNLTESPWVREVIIKDPNKHAMLSQSVNFGYDLNRLMTEQHHYRDIIKYFYINPRVHKNEQGKIVPDQQQVNQLINNSATLLYIITNEFFAIDHIDKKEVYRLLTYEEMAGLSKTEFEILLELIDLKYGDKLKGKILPFKAKKEEVSKWMGNILFSLSQFDKIRNEYQTKKEEIKEDLAAKNFYNVWSILSQMTDNLYNEELFKLLKEDKIENVKNKLDWVKTGMAVYEHFQNQDYVGAANKTFNLVQLVMQDMEGKHSDTSYTNFKYQFGNLKVSFEPKTENDFNVTIKNAENNDPENSIKLSFSGNNLKACRTQDPSKFIEIKDYLVFAKYLSQAKNTKKLKELLTEDSFQKYHEVLSYSDYLGSSEKEMMQLINYAYLAKNASDKNLNLSEVLKQHGLELTKDLVDRTFKNKHDKYYNQLTTLLSFFGDVLTVKDEHQLAGVIDSYALPPTSYKMKRKKVYSIDLNGYVGAFAGSLAAFKDTSISPQFVYGITAPLGVAFTWSHKDRFFDNFGLTVDVLDLGNIVNHYLMTTDNDYTREVHFSEVFSLGTTFLMGIRNSPFVLSGGFKFLPLQSYEKNGQLVNRKAFDAGIFHLGIKIDIPLIHLFGKDF